MLRHKHSIKRTEYSIVDIHVTALLLLSFVFFVAMVTFELDCTHGEFPFTNNKTFSVT